MSIVISHKGSFTKTLKFLRKIQSDAFMKKMDAYGRMGVDALRQATPKKTGLTSESWYYEIHTTASSIEITWLNTNNNHGVYIAVLIQYGHGTRNGGYVQGRDYINPAMKPIFEKIASDLWGEVIKA